MSFPKNTMVLWALWVGTLVNGGSIKDWTDWNQICPLFTTFTLIIYNFGWKPTVCAFLEFYQDEQRTIMWSTVTQRWSWLWRGWWRGWWWGWWRWWWWWWSWKAEIVFCLVISILPRCKGMWLWARREMSEQIRRKCTENTKVGPDWHKLKCYDKWGQNAGGNTKR